MKRTGAKVPAPEAGEHWVFHRGALGDSVLLWPMLRQWRMRRIDVVLVCDGEKGRLAARELSIRTEDAESARFNTLWVPGAPVEPVKGAVSVVAYLGRGGEGTQAWMANARRMFPNAAITHRSVRPNRIKALRFPLPALRASEDGPVVMHIGAGAEEKRWPVARWVALVDALRGGAGLRPAAGGVRLIAGEVESEQLGDTDLTDFLAAGGKFLRTLDELAAAIRSASVFVAGDSGPGHLAAQLGVPTVSLFGPGNPERWAPVGPAVLVVAPPSPRGMEWLSPEVVLAAIREVAASRSSEPRP